MLAVPSAEAWKGRRVLVTGHTGFKGSWLVLWLGRLGAIVHGLALDPIEHPSNFESSRLEGVLGGHTIVDIRDSDSVMSVMDSVKPDVVFHLAAQPIVRSAHHAPQETFDVNVMGTVNVLDAVRLLDRPCCVVVVTSDKCYARPEDGHRLVETDPLGGTELYGATKAAAELAVAAYRTAYFAPGSSDRHGTFVATARAGNVIGGGDWARDRLLPDVARALGAGVAVEVRHPDAVRPWQHVLEPLSGYLRLAEALRAMDMHDGIAAGELCSAFNFGPEAADEVTVRTVVDRALQCWGGGRWTAARPHVGDAADLEAPSLRLDSTRAQEVLGWRPVWSHDEAVRRSIAWYRRFLSDPDQDMSPACHADIDAYEAAATTTGERR